MIDIQFIRDNPELVAEKSKQKGYDVDIKRLLELDEKRRQLLPKQQEVKQARNELAAAAKGSKPTEVQIQQGKELKEQDAKLEEELKQILAEYEPILQSVPNMPLEDVPVGAEEDSVEVKRWGEQTQGAKDHLEIAEDRDWVDFERGAKVAGAKFYFLKGDLALLENALIQFAVDFVVKKGFTFMSVPHMVNSRTAQGAGFAPKSSEESNEYFIEDEDLSLIGTSEAPLTGYHADEIIEEERLPLMYAGLSPCYRKEAGTYGKHTRGLFRVHQFNKLEMYAFVLPGKSKEVHEQILALEEEIWRALEIPYQVINIASGDLGAPAAKKYDVQYWSPVDETYREITSCSNCTDYQARSLKIRVKRQDGSVEYLHTLNGTVLALARTLVVMIENHQTKEGNVRIPEALQPYMNGKKEI
jgi:seryl-tRNA synthetase